MFNAIVKAFLLGLSTGIVCVGYCAPVFVPLMLAEERKGFTGKLMPFLQFVLGRLVVYLFVGLVGGFTGSLVASKIPGHFIGLSFVGLSILMIIYGLRGGFPNLQICKFVSPVMNKIKVPFLFGVFMGLNLCPPFLLAITDVVVFGKIYYGVIFFFVFFLVTSLFLLPFVFLGYLSSFHSLRTVARLAALIIGVIYFSFGVTKIFT